jgi:hypothetical protein
VADPGRVLAARPDQAGLAVALPLRRAAAVIEGVVTHGDIVFMRLYGHPVAPQAKRIRVIVSTLWEAAWAEVTIPGRS